MRPFLQKMKVDEDKEYGLLNLAQFKRNCRVIETDHNGLVLDMNLQVEKNKPERKELFNFRNKLCQEAFHQETENKKELLECFENNLSVIDQSKKWKKSLNNILHKCFRKIRIVKKKEYSKTDDLLKERIVLKKKTKLENIEEKVRDEIRARIKEIEEEIGEDAAFENHKAIVDAIKDLGDDSSLDGSGRRKMWSLLKKRFPKSDHITPTAKKNSQGNLVTNHRELKKLYLKTYTQRMRNRPIKAGHEDMKKMKYRLFNARLKLASTRKSVPWEMKNLEAAIKGLKKGKPGRSKWMGQLTVQR